MGKLKRQRKKIKKWWDGYIDFSYLSIEGYQYIKSTYVEGIASGLITEESIEIINKLIPLFNQKEGLFSRFSRLFYERRGKDKELESSFLFRLYCNGFTEAYKNIDKKIKYSTNKLIFPSIKDCKAAVDQYIKELDDRDNCPTIETKNSSLFRDYILDLGEHEGAIVRFLEYKQEYEKDLEEEKSNTQKVGRTKKENKLSELFTVKVLFKETVTEYILDYINKNNTGKDLAYLRIALEELYYTNRMEHEEYYRALCLEFTEEKIQIKSDTIRNNYNSLLRKDEDEAFMARDLPFHRKKIDEIKDQLIKFNSINSGN